MRAGRCRGVEAQVIRILPGVSLPFTLAVFRVESGNHAAFKRAWTALCTAFLALPKPPASPMRLIQSADDRDVFQSLGAWHSDADIQAMRTDPQIVPLMQAMMSLCLEGKPGAFELLETVPDDAQPS